MTLFNKKWWSAALNRAIRTFCQTGLSMLTVGQAFIDVDWKTWLSVSGVAFVISILTSVVGLPEVNVEVNSDEY